ncbi:aminoacyl-tRNA hydrolase [Pelagicoccus sp. SDUM812002]|uniref:aminoacyl-tRNA hydrolase n=1 Tax=Pelagicoccus sp. SDUM812002 TaxID=3041266 RepID=UPI0028104BBC|nr:aminoacyl-tRNA hydrolase [Pelagicoccus sp. SDUM812002]MDQ8186931.1 aminoacyl-tRNA hydrolase [Pelagicoccus sp. SDUM812002]
MSYRMIVGLGNPGSEYANTRHNVGFRVVEAFAAKQGAEAWKVERKQKGEIALLSGSKLGKLVLVKPTTYMNESGICVQKLCSYYKIPPEEVVVVYDEINLEVGEVKLSMTGSAGGHNGLSDIISRIAPRFARIRVGIGGKPLKEMPLADYVLGKFSSDDESVVSATMDRYVESIELLLSLGPELAMNQINRKRKPDDSNSI